MSVLRGWRRALPFVLVVGISAVGGYALAETGPSMMSGEQQQPPGQAPGGPGGMMGMGGMMGGMMGNAGDMMAGSGGMMGGQMGGPVQSTTPSAARALSQQEAATATIDRQTNSITYHSAHVQIVALASPDTGPNMTWSVEAWSTRPSSSPKMPR